MTTTIIDGLAGDKAHYARETDLSYDTWAVRLIAATMQVPSGSDYGRGLFADLDDEKEYTIYEQQGASPAATDFPVKNVPLAVLSDDLLAKIGSIGTIAIDGPVSTTIAGQLVSLIVGNDYLIANGREITIAFPSGITPASTTLRFVQVDCSGAPETFSVVGTATASGGTVACVFEIEADDWAGVVAGRYEWFLDVVDSNDKLMTPVKSRDQRVRFVEFIAF